MKECISPVYNVIRIIARHSENLFKTVTELQKVATESGNDVLVITDTTDIDYNSCLCNN